MDTRRILSYVRRACEDYGMIRAGDRVAVGVSAGKDSLTLLCALAEMRKFYPHPYEVAALTVNMGFPGMDFSPVAELCRQLEVPFHVVKTEISTVVFDIRKEKNPCSLCAKLRRGALHGAAKEMGYGTVALGHHFDDVVDTFMLNLFYEGRIGCFQPVTELSRVGVRVIRPMLYLPEKEIRYFASHEKLPVIKSPCPADGNTKRAEMKKLLSELERENKGLRYRIFGAIKRSGIDGFGALFKNGRLPVLPDPQTEPELPKTPPELSEKR
ncbi:MAG: ATP-binding protein [Eubacteriales bacterium]|nr:ATP-binding protein [Eubacteriales bacterium]